MPSDPVKVKAGRIGARARWADHVPVIIRLRDVEDPELKAAYLALHRLGESRNPAVTAETRDAAKSNAPASSRAEASMLPEVRRVSDDPTD